MTKAWPSVALGDIALITMGQSPPGETYNTAADGLPFFQGKAEFGTDYPTTVKWCSAPQRTAIEGDILLSVRAPVGPTNIATEKCCIGRGLAAIRAKDGKANTRFLRYFLRRFEFDLTRQGVGSTFSAINRRDIERMQLLLPPLNKQDRIVAILDATEELRRLREQADRRTADLIPALFHEMFGTRDESATKTLGEIVQSIDSGWSPVCRAESAAPNEWGVLKLGAVTTGTFLGSENKALPEEEVPRPAIEVEAGDILFTRKNTKELVAAVAYVWETRPKLLLSDLIFRLRPKVGVSVESVYLAYALKKTDKRREIQSLASGAAGSMPNISKQRLSGVKVSLPPLSLQRVFAGRVAGIRAIEVSQAVSHRRLDNLFLSLLHRAFNGEL